VGVFVALAIIGNLLPQDEEDNATASESTTTAVTTTPTIVTTQAHSRPEISRL
jgi:hypothetical protein